MRSVAKSIRNNILVGLILLTPIVVTGLIVNWLFNFTTRWMVKYVPKEWLAHYPDLIFKAVALLAMLILLFFVGLLARNILGKKLYQIGDMVIARIPFINKIYVSVRQISEAIVDQSQTMFKEVVLIEYPRKGLFSMGFVTANVPKAFAAAEPNLRGNADLVTVFIATTPNPTSGFFVLVPRSDVTVLPISVAEAMKLVVSAGAVFPGSAGIDSRPTLLDKLEQWVARDGKAEVKRDS